MLTSSDPSSGECFHSKSTIFTTDEAMRREFNSFLDLIKQYFPERDFGFFFGCESWFVAEQSGLIYVKRFEILL
jgi:hypothetical protein